MDLSEIKNNIQILCYRGEWIHNWYTTCTTLAYRGTDFCAHLSVRLRNFCAPSFVVVAVFVFNQAGVKSMCSFQALGQQKDETEKVAS